MNKIYVLYIFSILSLFLYSFTQVDLGLALTKFPGLFIIQRAFQNIGFFNRPLSALFYITVIISLFISYFLILKKSKINKTPDKRLWKLILITCLLLLVAYNAFSHDLFNYIFDAKIFTFYGKNPYQYKALDFPGDPMLGFMHWTHRIYPYGPVWLAVTIPLSYLSLQKFILNFILFKALAVLSYLGSVVYISKIAKKIMPKYECYIVSYFAFNPLIIIESLVSGHIDIFMLFLSIISIYYLTDKKYLLAVIFLVLSIGVKFATVFLVPVFLVTVTLQIARIKIPWNLIFATMLASLVIAVIAQTQVSGNFQPWYLLILFPFFALSIRNIYLLITGIIMSAGSLVTYVPYLYFGNWDDPVPQFLNRFYILTASFIVLFNIFLFILKFKIISEKSE